MKMKSFFYNYIEQNETADMCSFQKVKATMDAAIVSYDRKKFDKALAYAEDQLVEAKKAYDAAKAEEERIRKEAEDAGKKKYEEEHDGVKTVLFRHNDSCTYLHAPSVRLTHIKWADAGHRMGTEVFNRELALAVVWTYVEGSYKNTKSYLLLGDVIGIEDIVKQYKSCLSSK